MRDLSLHVMGRGWELELGERDDAFQISGFPSLPPPYVFSSYSG